MQRVTGKVAIVTGAAGGIGLATARAIGQEGGRVLASDIDGAAVLAAAEGLRGEGIDAIGVRHDIADAAHWDEAIALALGRWGRLDALVNNAAAFGRAAPFWETSVEEWKQVVDVNVIGCFLGMKLVVPHMRERGGAIVNISSILGKVGIGGSAAYCASKGAVTVVTKAAALDCADAGLNIRINSVHPGFVMKPALRLPEGEEKLAAFSALHPMNRLGEPEEIAKAILFMISDESSFMTGSEVLVDGGYTAR